MMISPPDLLLFLAALVAVYLLPGPDMALVLSTSAFGGPRRGLAAALGLALSRTLHVTLSAMGLAALFYTHPMLFDAVRWLGAAWLAWLTWKIVTTKEASAAATSPFAAGPLAALQRGVMTNLLNPKALLFCALLLPQFVSPQHDLAAQYLLLGTILVATGLLFDAAYALAAARLAARFSGSHSIRNASRVIFAGIFGAAALRLAMGGG